MRAKRYRAYKSCNTVLGRLRDFGIAGMKKWPERYTMDATARETVFVNRLYADVVGMPLDLPEPQVLLERLFDHVCIEKRGYISGFDKLKKAWMYTLRAETKTGFDWLRSMVVHGYLGGTYVYTEGEELRIHEFGAKYLEVGDVVLGMKLAPCAGDGTCRRVESSYAVVCIGYDRFAYADSCGKMELCEYEDILWCALMDDVFFVCAPHRRVMTKSDNADL